MSPGTEDSKSLPAPPPATAGDGHQEGHEGSGGGGKHANVVQQVAVVVAIFAATAVAA